MIQSSITPAVLKSRKNYKALLEISPTTTTTLLSDRKFSAACYAKRYSVRHSQTETHTHTHTQSHTADRLLYTATKHTHTHTRLSAPFREPPG